MSNVGPGLPGHFSKKVQPRPDLRDFAQELGVSLPVSRQRLKKQWDEMARV